MSDPRIPAADFSQLIPQGGEGGGRETDLSPHNAREPLPHQPLVTQLPSYDPAKSLADQIAEVLGEPPAQRSDEQVVMTPSSFASQTPPTPPPAQEQVAQPSPAVTPPPAPQSPVQGEGEGGSDAVSGSSAAPPNLPSEEQGGQEDPNESPHFSLDTLARELYGRDVTADEAAAIIQLWRDASSLTPEQKHQVAVAMGYVEDTTPQPPPATTPPPSPQYQNQGADDDSTDPYLAPHLTPLQEELAQLRNQVQHLVTNNQLSDQQRMQQEVNSSMDAFRESHPYLSEEEHVALRLRAKDRGVLAAEYQRTGDLTSAVQQALEYEMWQDENFRNKALQVQAEQQREVASQDAARQQRAASLGPGGSQVPRDDVPTPPGPVDRMTARQGMIADLAPLFNQS